MRRTTPRLTALGAAFALTLGMVMPGTANDGTEVAPLKAPPVADDQSVNELPHTWFVELKSQPIVKGGTPDQLERERDAFLANARSQGIELSERLSFDTLWNGLSVTVDTAQLESLRRIPGVTAIYPVMTIAVPETPQTSPDLETALAMTGADTAQAELGLSGEGVRVAVMDTGVDYDHSDLGGDGTARANSTAFPNSRVVAGWDFVGDAFNANASAPDYDPDPVSDAYPDDCQGHGTHVAGIVGADGDPADGGARGVAPGVSLGSYRVFGCDGSTTADIMIAAMERALDDDMDVLNMSIGSAFAWPQYPTAVASDNLVDAGMVVVASIGNSGANGVYSTGAPGNGAKVIGVASFDNTHINAPTFIVNPSGQQTAYLKLATTIDPPTSGTSDPVVYIGRGCPAGDGVADEDPYLADPSGKVALIVRGTCTFNGKYRRATDAGATAVVIHNNLDGLFAGGGVVDRGVPGVGISRADGEHIRSLLDAGTSVTLTWTDERINAPNPTGGLISSFSSYGLAPDLSLKPNLGGPGGLIRSTYPLEKDGYATISGTSMSAPHVAGAAALHLEAHPGSAPSDVKVAFQNRAEPKVWSLAPGLGFLDHTFRQGAGMVDIPDAVLASARVTPSEIAMGESESGPQTHALTITNSGSEAVTYELSHVGALGAHGNTYSPRFNASFASVTFDSASVVVAPGGSATVQATIVAPAQPARGQYGGYIVLNGDDDSVMRVPYAGFIGDYQTMTAMPVGDVFPTLARLTGCSRFVGTSCTMGGSYALADHGEVYTLEDGLERPYFLVHLDHQVRELRLEVFDASTGRNWGRIGTFDYFGRNSTPSAFFAFAFDGEMQSGRGGRTLTVPDGTYEVRVSVLKALGDSANPSHWETWTSQTFEIDRP